jgi:uncharacterized membrane protein YphA (DoxX/SURF4 family)
MLIIKGVTTMNTALWVVQILLTLVFLMVGSMKLIQPKEKLATTQGWVDGFEESHLKLIGTLEILGALGLILPGILGILPMLTPLAALGLAAMQVGAFITHTRRQEYPNLIVNVILLAMALFVAYGRFAIQPL